MPDLARWVTDTSVFTHLCRAGHSDLLQRLAPGGVILVPDAVEVEIRRGQERYPGIPGVSDTPWVELALLTEDEQFTQLLVKAAMGGGSDEHLGECAVIACAKHRGCVALIDERAAISQAGRHGVRTHDTIWLVIEAYLTLSDYDRSTTERVIDDLVATGMRLPIASGASLLAWAYTEGLLAR